MVVQIYTKYLKKTNNLPLIFKKHHKTTEDGILILCFFSSVADNKRVRHRLMTHPHYTYLYIVLYSTIILLLENQHSRAHFSY